jgi:hypothetical protein
MTWGYIGVAAVAAGTSYLSQSAAASGQAGGIDSQNQLVARRNKAVVEANVENTVRTGYRVGLLNLQQGQAKKAQVQQGFDTRAAAQEIMGSLTANAAATGTVGASAQAVEVDVLQRLGEAQAAQSEGWDLQLLNFNTQLVSILESGEDTLQGAGGEVVKAKGASEGQMLTNALVAGAASFASNYAMRTMNLGLGTQSGAGQSPANISRGGSFSPSI